MSHFHSLGSTFFIRGVCSLYILCNGEGAFCDAESPEVN